MPIFPPYSGPPLLDQVVSVENLTLAWRRVRGNIHVARRARSAGFDAMTVRDFEADWLNQMRGLAEELQTGSYRPLPARHVTIPKASGGERAIAILAIRDRVAQRAVQQVLQPLFEPLFLDCSYGCRLYVVEAGRPSLALDMMEEFRPLVIDRLVLELLKAGALRRDQFERPAHRPDAVYLDATGRALLVERYEAAMSAPTRLASGEQTPMRRVVLLQAQAVARIVRGEQAEY
ncbi:CRISPR-associated endonuclease Cas1 [Candidatus Viridilinea mediisalina]|uniref:Uncharacterized protein n=1 Tax=Candidatus Viridilinea mediisalina TaxID=2024553 RepID=A0A2A6RMJ3_9CHLR|nr:CRISPR-associated endonuclease Cas1 [Candidatus Viridilinea mediisalina]PDW04079.1 hypothetical protein CJ255_05145 [Candidatus Viridilinea mediisalina]